ncbi:hypothetical protein [Actinomadura sp. WMMB 499]|uniref:hypothetical protein n=1 Tax=Actinomadura sp. WMMB 499 TaxID=1219491 RepID=UPI0012452904|nr:hypothetical protein [Actinomadura sp. WMMB 499]QFG23444.1 hypothetical protein F7P10_22315 [Actinomadura sp. WMMB 499]
MIVTPIKAGELLASNRLDAKYHTAPAVMIRSALANLANVELRTLSDYASVRAPGRFKRTYAADGEEFVSYLRPYDVFDYLPFEADKLSRARTEALDDYLIRAGDLLQSCSGRNLGPLTIADAHLAKFALSHDMIRVSINDHADRLYTLAFLRTPTGQHLLRGDLNGSVIDHITVEQVAAISVPFVRSVQRDVSDLMRHATELRERARIKLDEVTRGFAASLPKATVRGRRSSGWTLSATGLNGRLDAAFHDPAVADIRAALKEIGGVYVKDVAASSIPGRYRRYYVDAEHGRPIVSGRQLLQSLPINLKYISERSFDYSAYELTEGMIAFGAEGRAEERIAQPALISSDRAGWLANNHVMRVRPNPGVNPGWLYLAFVVPQVQMQVKACSAGSVVDAVNASDLGKVILPPMDNVLGDTAIDCWNSFAEASETESRAIQMLESEIATASQVFDSQPNLG